MDKTGRFRHQKGGAEICSKSNESMESFLKNLSVLNKAFFEQNGIDYVGFQILVKYWDNNPEIPIERAVFEKIRKLSFISEVVVKFHLQNSRLAFQPFEGDTEYYLKKQIQFGASLRAARESKGISYQDVFNKLGISEISLKKLESGRAKCEYWLAKSLEDFYDVHLEDFLP